MGHPAVVAGVAKAMVGFALLFRPSCSNEFGWSTDTGRPTVDSPQKIMSTKSAIGAISPLVGG
jgi:hypothetical protein